MKLIIGLGNPGEKYQNNRHNVGHRFVDWLETSLKNKVLNINQPIKILKTDEYMNDSGKFVAREAKMYKVDPEDIFLVHDDLDIRIGQFKIQHAVGPKIHYGVNSVEEHLGDKGFWRVRVGVDNRDLENRIPGETYVLQNFTDEERKTLDEVFGKIGEEMVGRLTSDESIVVIK